MNGTERACETAFLDRVVLSEAQALTITCLLSLLAPFITVVNLLLCFSLLKTKQAKRKSQRFVLILGISDTCVGAISAPVMAVTFSLFHKTRICWYEKFSLFVGHFNTRLSAYVVFLIGLDRYFNIITDFRSESYLRKLTQSDTGQRALFFIVLMATFAQGSLTVVEIENRSLPNSISSGIDAMIYFSYLLIYIRLYYKVRKFSKNNSIHLDPGGQTTRGFRPLYVRNLIKTVLYLLLSVGFCYLPYVIMKFTVTYIEFKLERPVGQSLRFAHYMSFQPVIFNSFFNTLIILNRNSVLKNYVKSVMSFWRKNQVNFQQTEGVQPSASGLHEVKIEPRRRLGQKDVTIVERNTPVVPRRKIGRVRFFVADNSVLPVIEDIEKTFTCKNTSSKDLQRKENQKMQGNGCLAKTEQCKLTTTKELIVEQGILEKSINDQQH